MMTVHDKTYYFNTQTGRVHWDLDAPDIYNLILCRYLDFTNETNDLLMTYTLNTLNTAFKNGILKYKAPESFCVPDATNNNNIINFIKSLSLVYHNKNESISGGIEIYQRTNGLFHIILFNRSFNLTVDSTKEKIIKSIEELLETPSQLSNKHSDILKYLSNSDILDTYFDNLSGYSDSYFN